ncbi:hypothetical protein SI65_04577 [Aspergillus cristatus]|uniref:t-SNARE coiled-coil homology domain-containing protein n=1 Tax=Aspergillus cristatus TaxID=573508 RepID=A0A1E3BF57_ASPCR|nr:hypothetical protein SI65_04577 [Aspergillus cristatus]
MEQLRSLAGGFGGGGSGRRQINPRPIIAALSPSPALHHLQRHLHHLISPHRVVVYICYLLLTGRGHNIYTSDCSTCPSANDLPSLVPAASEPYRAHRCPVRFEPSQTHSLPSHLSHTNPVRQSAISRDSAMTNASQLFLLADHIKLSLLERQRAISLSLEPNSQDGEISRSLESLREGIEASEAEQRRLEEAGDEDAADWKDQLDQLRIQFRDLSVQFHGGGSAGATLNSPNDPALASDFARANNTSPDLKQPVPQHPPSKNVRFMAAAADEDEDPNRRNLFQPYRDSPSPPGVDQSGMDNQQIHAYHSQVLRDQDDQLDRLGESIGRQHQLSIQIGDELDGHIALLDEVDEGVDRHQTRLDRAKKGLDKVRRSAGDNWSLMTIVGLIIILIILIVILK